MVLSHEDRTVRQRRHVCSPGLHPAWLLVYSGLAFGKQGMFSGTVTQGILSWVQTAAVGAGNEGSAKAPTAVPTIAGANSASQNTVVPHSGQKCRLSQRPASNVRVKVLNVPATASRLLC